MQNVVVPISVSRGKYSTYNNNVFMFTDIVVIAIEILSKHIVLHDVYYYFEHYVFYDFLWKDIEECNHKVFCWYPMF